MSPPSRRTLLIAAVPALAIAAVAAWYWGGNGWATRRP